MRTAFEYEGEIRGIDLLACLVTVWRQSASGSLQFSRSGATAGFEIANGEIAATSSSDPRFETAAILVRAGKLDTRTLERLAAPEGADRALLALQAGVLTRREYRWGEKIRAVEILSDLLSWLEGEYFFFDTSEAPKESAEPRLPVPRLILELFLRSRDRSLVLKYLGGADVPLARAANFDAEFATFGLTADAESVVRLIDGTSSAEEIASEAPAEAFAIEKLLAALVTLGLVHPAFAAAAPAEGHPASVPTEAATEEAEAAPPESAESREDEALEEEVSEEEEEEEGVEQEYPAELPAEAPPPEPEPVESWEAEPEVPVSESHDEREAGPTELGEPIEDEAVSEEEPVDAPLAGRTVAPDLEFAALGDEPGRAGREEHLAADIEGGPAVDAHADTAELGPADRPPARSGSPFLWVLVLLAAAVGAIVWLRGRGPSEPTRVAAVNPTATGTPAGVAGAAPSATTPEAAVPTPVPTAVPAPTSVPPTVAPAKARPTARPAKGRSAAPAPTTTPAAAADTRDASRQHWLDRAAHDQQRLSADRKTRYAIQLELACETTSLVDAFQHDHGGNMWVLSTPYEGKTCFRVLWGRYPSIEAAHRAVSSAPKFFSTGKNRPVVTGVR
jgi:hypothetical protein